MGITVGEAIDRCFSEFLEKAGKGRPSYEINTTTWTTSSPASGGTFTVTGRTGTATSAKGRRVEIGSEIVDVRSISGTTWTVEERAVQESVAAAHASGDKVLLAPEFYRVQVQNALKSLISQLYSWGIYRRVAYTTATYSEVTPPTMPATTVDVPTIRVKNADNTWGRRLTRGLDYDVMTDMAPVKVQFYSGGYEGATLQIVYKADFDTSTFTEATDLDTVGVPATLQPFLPMGAAAYLLEGREVSHLNVETVRQAIAQQTAQAPPGSIQRASEMLLYSFKSNYVAAERERLLRLDGTRIVGA